MTAQTKSATDYRAQLTGAVSQNAQWSVTGILERLFAKTFTGLVYAQIWEDPRVDMDALDIRENDHIVAIASGGCNVLSYLTARPCAITAVDLSPAHIALNRLKYAAAHHLPDHETFFRLFGQADQEGNAALFDDLLKQHLDVHTVDWWSARKGLRGRRIDMFEQGLYRFGALGRFIGWGHRIGRMLGVDFREYMACETREEQILFFDTVMRPALDNRLIRFATSNRASLFGLGIPPQQYEALAGAADGDMHAVLVERLRTLMCDFALSDNYFAWAAFNRGYDPSGKGPLPPYLQSENWSALQANAHKVHVENRTVTDLLTETEASSRDCFVLLDAQDWMTDQQLNDLWTQITRTARPGARVIYRTAGLNCILPGRIDDATLQRWHYDYAASQRGQTNDRSAIYGGFHLYRLKN